MPAVMKFLQIHDMLSSSRANGPGNRAVIWLQGCNFKCPGCFNPETHSTDGIYGKWISLPRLIHWLQEAMEHNQIEGVTISGGEPMLQWGILQEFLQWIRNNTTLSVILFTGFTVKELDSQNIYPQLLPLVDVLLAGRYNQNMRVAAGLLGSSNKQVEFLTDYYDWNDLAAVPVGEVIIRNGEIIFSGINPAELTK
jgi:anaerobic ribonucleoside-triphosphate reductase activating protein